MEEFVKGDVVVVSFPFTDMSEQVNRPSLVLSMQNQDVIVCQITTKSRSNVHEIVINTNDFVQGNLKIKSYVKPLRIVTIHSKLIKYKLGFLKKEKTEEVINKICEVLKR